MQLTNPLRINFRFAIVGQQAVHLLLDVSELCVAEAGKKF
jgi:hypothetical protein